jgi:hypothetical protein
VPHYVIDGFAPQQFENMLAGITYGWLAKNRGLAVPLKLQAGEAILTTFRFPEYGRDPYSTHLFDGLVQALISRTPAAIQMEPAEIQTA